jgi:predicted deacylase
MDIPHMLESASNIGFREKLSYPLLMRNSITIGQVGSIAINIPIVTIGSGQPHLALLCGVHGDETASLVICSAFAKQLSRCFQLKGSVSIITSANPFAQSTKTRVNVSDYYDLNRTGRGKPDGTLTERVAYKLCEFLSTCSFVIDIHELDMESNFYFIQYGDVCQ